MPFFLKIFLQTDNRKNENADVYSAKNIFSAVTLNLKRDKMTKTVFSDKAPKPVGPYSQGMMAGKLLFISGQLPIDPGQGKIVASDIGAQTKRVMENIKAGLESADYSLKDIVSTTVYLSSMALFEEFNAEYAKFFDGEFPARATVGCELEAGAHVEVSAIAFRS